jgi:hypothetical protein
MAAARRSTVWLFIAPRFAPNDAGRDALPLQVTASPLNLSPLARVSFKPDQTTGVKPNSAIRMKFD